MLTIDYAIAPVGDGTPEDRLATADETTLRYSSFPGDVILVVDDIDLSARWGWVPVLDFALALDDLVDALAAGPDRREVLEFTESDATLTFARTGDAVTVHASWVTDAAVVPYAELRAAAKRFLGRLLADLVRDHPPLAHNPVLVERFGGATLEELSRPRDDPRGGSPGR
jgi:hypothetical protein